MTIFGQMHICWLWNTFQTIRYRMIYSRYVRMLYSIITSSILWTKHLPINLPKLMIPLSFILFVLSALAYFIFKKNYFGSSNLSFLNPICLITYGSTMSDSFILFNLSIFHFKSFSEQNSTFEKPNSNLWFFSSF